MTEKRIDELNSEIFRLAEPHTATLDLIRTVPVLSKKPLAAIRILSEIGADMSVFPSSKHLVSWAGCCPRNDSSAPKGQVHKNIPCRFISQAYTCVEHKRAYQIQRTP